MIIEYHNVTESVTAAYEYRRITYVESDLSFLRAAMKAGVIPPFIP